MQSGWRLGLWEKMYSFMSGKQRAGYTNPSGKWNTEQTAQPENARRFHANEELRQPLSLLLG